MTILSRSQIALPLVSINSKDKDDSSPTWMSTCSRILFLVLHTRSVHCNMYYQHCQSDRNYYSALQSCWKLFPLSSSSAYLICLVVVEQLSIIHKAKTTKICGLEALAAFNSYVKLVCWVISRAPYKMAKLYFRSKAA